MKKKSKRCFVGMLAFVLALSFSVIAGFTGCDNDPANDGDPITSKTALEEKIDEAKDLLEETREAEDAASVPQGLSWATSAVRSAFQTAIDAAQSVLDNATTQSQINVAKDALDAAIGVFNSATETGTGEPLELDSLSEKISDAEEAKEGVVVDTSASNVNQGVKWVTSEVMNTFNDAIDAAKTVKNTSNSQSEVNTAVTTLTTAIATFNSAKQDGTKTPAASSITINGFDVSFNGEMIQLGLYKNEEDIPTTMGVQPDIWGYAEVADGTVTIDLLEGDGTPWIGSESYFVGFASLGEESDISEIRAFISKEKINFTANPNLVVNFSDFEKLGFLLTFGELAGGEEFLPMTLDELISFFEDKTYAEFAEEYGMKFFKDRAMTTEYSGNETISPEMKLYTAYPILFDDGRGDKIGEISGTITLTDIPDGVRVSIRTRSPGWSYTSRIQGTSDKTSGTFDWKIPLYENDDFTPSSETSFILFIDSGSSHYEVIVPGLHNVPSVDAEEIDLGTVSLKAITISGTLSVTFNGKPVPYVRINIRHSGWIWLGEMEIINPGSNINWSMLIPVQEDDTLISFNVRGYPSRNSDWEDMLFDVTMDETGTTVKDQNVSGIILNLGDITE